MLYPFQRQNVVPVVFGIALSLSLISCSQAPNIPLLKQRSPHSIETILIGKELTAKNIRDIFDSLNEDGSLDSLKVLIDGSPDSDLEEFKEFLNRYLIHYEDAPHSVISVLEDLNRKKAFSQLFNFVLEQKNHDPDNFSVQRGALQKIIASSHFPGLIERDVAYLSDKFLTLLKKFLQRTRNSSSSLLPPEQFQAALYSELHSFALNAPMQEQWIRLSSDLEAMSLPSSLLRSVAIERNSSAFKGFAKGIKHLLTQSPPQPTAAGHHHLDSLLFLVDQLSSGWEELFPTIERALLNEPELAGEISQFFQPWVTEAMGGYVVERSLRQLTGTPIKALSSLSLYQLFIIVRKAIEDLQGPIEDPDDLDHNHPIYLTSFALAKWIQKEALRLSPSLTPEETWKTRLASSLFEVDLIKPRKWLMSTSRTELETELLNRLEELILIGAESELPIQKTKLAYFELYDVVKSKLGWGEGISPSRFLGFLKADNSSLVKTLSSGALKELITLLPTGFEFPAQSDLHSLGLDSLNNWLRKHAFWNERAVDSLHFQIEVSAGTTFRDSLTGAFRQCEETRKLVDAKGFTKALLFLLTRKNEIIPSTLGSFVTPSLLDWVNLSLQGKSISQIRELKKHLFEKLKIAELSNDDRKTLLSFFKENPSLKDKVSHLLQSSSSAYEFDRKLEPALPTAFEFYLNWIKGLPYRDLGGIGKLAHFISNAGWFSIESLSGEWFARHPFIYSLAANDEMLENVLGSFALMDAGERDLLLSTITDSLGGPPESSGMRTHLEILRSVLPSHGKAVRAWIRSANDKKFEETISTLLEYNNERQLFTYFTKNGDLQKVFASFNSRVTRSNLHKIITELKSLFDRKVIRKALSLLKYIRHDRLQRAGSVLLQCEISGECYKLLSLVETFLDPTDEKSGLYSPEKVSLKVLAPPVIKGPEASLPVVPEPRSSDPSRGGGGSPVPSPQTTKVDTPSITRVFSTESVPPIRIGIDPEIGGSTEGTLSCLTEGLALFLGGSSQNVAPSSCHYSNTIMKYQKTSAPLLPCQAKVIEYGPQQDDKGRFVMADGSCVIETPLAPVKEILEDVSHYRQVLRKDPEGREILESGFRYVREYRIVDPENGYQPWAKDENPNPATIYGYLILPLGIHSHYLIDVSPLDLKQSEEYALTWSHHKAQSVKKFPHPLRLPRLNLVAVDSQYGNWYLKALPQGKLYVRYYLASVPSVIGEPPELVPGESGYELREGLYAYNARIAHQNTLMGLIQRIFRRKQSPK